jgi:hypothetical protein
VVTCGSTPADSSSRSAIAIAMPPIDADLEVEHHEVGVAVADRSGDAATVAADGERRVRAAERGGDLVDDPVGVGGEEDVHASDVIPGPRGARTRHVASREEMGRRGGSRASRSCTSVRQQRHLHERVAARPADSGASAARSDSAIVRSSAKVRPEGARCRNRPARRRHVPSIGGGARAEAGVDPVDDGRRHGEALLVSWSANQAPR